jgi:hypothetical protein
MPEIEVRISEPNFSFGADSENVYIIMKIDETTRKVMHMDPEGYVAWSPIDYPAGADVKPTLQLQRDIGPLLLEALLRRYQGASDMHTVRADLLHERGRVDKMIECMIRLNSSMGDAVEKLAEMNGA